MTAQQKKIVVLTGAGMSAESGFATFRDSGGLWETHPVEQVATPEGWQRDPNFVNEFYNGLRVWCAGQKLAQTEWGTSRSVAQNRQ